MISKPFTKTAMVSSTILVLSALAFAQNVSGQNCVASSLGQCSAQLMGNLSSNIYDIEYNTSNFRDDLAATKYATTYSSNDNIYSTALSSITPFLKTIAIFGIFWGTGSIAVGTYIMILGFIRATTNKAKSAKFIRWGGTGILGGSATGWLLGYSTNIPLMIQDFLSTLPLI